MLDITIWTFFDNSRFSMTVGMFMSFVSEKGNLWRKGWEWGYLLPRRMLMCRLPLMTVQPCRDWAASTESIVLVSQTLSHSPSQALQNILQMGERGRRRESKCQGQVPATHTDRLQTGKRHWTVTGLLCLTKTWRIFKACFWQTQGHCFMHLTESLLKPWVLCEKRIIKSAVRQNQVWSI